MERQNGEIAMVALSAKLRFQDGSDDSLITRIGIWDVNQELVATVSQRVLGLASFAGTS
jgi:hypothetical protein